MKKNITVKKLIKELKKYPMDAEAYAYGGEITGVVITKDNKQLGYIETQCG